jgi:uncharacterized repeat protein (TIGR01451 family)
MRHHPINYTLVVTNTGAAYAKGVVIEDPALPAFMTNVAVSVTSNDNTVAWTVVSTNPLQVKVTTLPTGSNMTIQIEADATPHCADGNFTQRRDRSQP